MTPKQLVEMVTSRPGYTNSVGTRVLFAEAGYVRLAVDRRPDLLQFNGFFHGGVISGLADHAAGGAVTTALPSGRIAVTIDLHVNFLSPADGASIVAKAKAIQIGNTVCMANVEIVTQTGGDERMCAFATVTLRVVDMPTSRTVQQPRSGADPCALPPNNASQRTRRGRRAAVGDVSST